jgi:alpha-L-arabinofuranosidase
LLAHAEGWQWTPDLIWFDNLRSYGTPNYYVQKLFGNHKGTHVLSITDGTEKLNGQNGLYGSAVLDKGAKEVIVKLVNASGNPLTTNLQLADAKGLSSNGTLIELRSDDMQAVNSLDKQNWVSPTEKSISVKGRNLALTLPAHSFSVVKVKMK